MPLGDHRRVDVDLHAGLLLLRGRQQLDHVPELPRERDVLGGDVPVMKYTVGAVLGVLLSATGVFIYAGTGVLCLLLSANFLDYSALATILGVDPVSARSHGIFLVEIGVGFTVMAVMVWIYYNLSSRGKHDEGL